MFGLLFELLNTVKQVLLVSLIRADHGRAATACEWSAGQSSSSEWRICQKAADVSTPTTNDAVASTCATIARQTLINPSASFL
jgi:hypothetical protein